MSENEEETPADAKKNTEGGTSDGDDSGDEDTAPDLHAQGNDEEKASTAKETAQGAPAIEERSMPKLPAKPSLKYSNSDRQITKSNSQYRVHFPDQEVTKIVETEVIIVPTCTQRVFYHVFCCCKRPDKS